jgi:hypothetical protein
VRRQRTGLEYHRRHGQTEGGLDIARKKRMPIGGSATWRKVSFPRIVTRPSRLPSPLKSPPIGTIANVRNAGTRERYGASLNVKRSALSGTRSSLKKSLMPSARVWRMPQGPAIVGPTRFWKSEMTLRRNQMLSITATSKNANAATALSKVTGRASQTSPA